MLTKSKVVQLVIMLIVLVTLFIWRTMTSDSEQLNNFASTSTEPVSELFECDYVKPCKFVGKQSVFWLSVANPPIKAEQWINFELKSNKKEWRVIDAKIVGKEMFMGRIPVTFTKVEKGIFAAKTLVGACTTPKMVWQLRINVEVNGIKKLLAFDFMIKK